MPLPTEMKWLNVAEPETAAKLIGCVISTTIGPSTTAGVIVETEFYREDDPASHTFGGRTDRNAPMFRSPGGLYVYRSYGLHWCANVVCGPEDCGSAVLIRAVRPLEGLDLMWTRRPKAKRETDLTSGWKVCAALGIEGCHTGSSLVDRETQIQLRPASPSEVSLTGTSPDPQVLSGPRIGISKATEQPWRFALADDPFVSSPRLKG